MGYPSFGGAGRRLDASHVSAQVESVGEPSAASRIRDLLRDLGIDEAHLDEARTEAARNATDIARELVAARRVDEAVLLQAMAKTLGIGFRDISDAETLLATPAPNAAQNILRTCGPEGTVLIYIAPKLEELDIVARLLVRRPAARSALAITTTGEIRRRRSAETVDERISRASLSLSAERLDISARLTLTGQQGAALASLAIAVVLSALQDWDRLLLYLHVASGIVFFAPTSLRLAAALSPPKRPLPPEPEAGAVRPIYSVLVALRQEDEVVGHLVRSLASLDWPRSKLQVLLVCEADDPDTIAAARTAIVDEPGFEIVVTPVSAPRTKPKALNFALPLATGEFVVLYDAEDRPDPQQLELAWRTFRAGDDRLACLQAELSIANGRQGWLPGLFALEYATLFRGLLPWLAAHGFPIPLGGTSNHFRRDHLVAAGAWDSHNVTEDADLGIRLHRQGYRIGTLRSATVEDAPRDIGVWYEQRTRWVKGWLQTYLVHMRDPRALYRDLGFKSFAIFQILFIGMIASALAHPIFLYLIGMAIAILAYGERDVPSIDILLAIDLFNAVAGVTAFLLLAMRTMPGPERRWLLPNLSWIYVYWMLVGISTARAVCELVRRPHHWAKTPHAPPFVPDIAETDKAIAQDPSSSAGATSRTLGTIGERAGRAVPTPLRPTASAPAAERRSERLRSRRAPEPSPRRAPDRPAG
ncbi:hypothetical protein ASG43_01920 [Aureimonas sp. Leaf454]|uniref:glycosyltransferase n=1 Tax=Aureimonas sp. Leaf454 TaxID=1736381 RepID=UPI0006FD520B|nr:glycosyltransferase [Aureimonas sp. Leaf454]KQT54388.1 hypothetical protein ASG43_01920 [Aureimonas sp. Leaf454]